MSETKTKYPSAVYAAAGVGDLVYQQLRKLQDRAIAFGSDAGATAPEWKKKVADLGTKLDAEKVRESVVTGTQFAAEKATKVYDTLVTRGERAFATRTEAPEAAAATPAAKKAAPVAKKAAPRKKAV